MMMIHNEYSYIYMSWCVRNDDAAAAACGYNVFDVKSE